CAGPTITFLRSVCTRLTRPSVGRPIFVEFGTNLEFQVEVGVGVPAVAGVTVQTVQVFMDGHDVGVFQPGGGKHFIKPSTVIAGSHPFLVRAEDSRGASTSKTQSVQCVP